MILRRGYEFTTGYRLQAYLGKGQFGEVWRASGPGGVALAAKFIDLEGGRGQKEYAAIRRIKSIRHANLMPITAIWQLDAEGQLIDEPPEASEQTSNLADLESRGQSGFVVSPGTQPSTLIVGMSLGDASLEKYLPKRGEANPQSKIPTGELLKFMEGTARGLDFLNSPVHDFGQGPVSLQHCDVKPANIVLIGDSAVLCDFGLARILARNQVTMTNPSGTPAYMSPEAIDGKPSRTSDQYSLAVTYYHLRTGTLPINDASVHRVLQAHLSGTLDFGRLQAEEQAILRRATHHDWQKRFESNSHFIGAIRDVLAHLGVSTSGQLSRSLPDTSSPSSGQVPGPSGPAAKGLETFDSENLTDGIVQHSKGGTPILSGDLGSKASHDTWMPGEPLDSSDDQQPQFDSSDVRAIVDSASGSDISINPSPTGAPDAFQFGSGEPQPLDKAGWSKVTIASLTAFMLLVVAGGFWLTRQLSVDSQNQPPTTSPYPSPAETAAIVNGDLNSTRHTFEKLAETNPRLMTVEAKIDTAHKDAIETLIPVGDKNGFVTTGYDAFPKLWKLDPSFQSENQFPNHLKSNVIAELDAKTVYANAVRVSLDAKWLFCAGGDELVAWPVETFNSTESDGFPVAPKRRWKLSSDVFAVAIHPQKTHLAVVACEDQKLFVVNANNTANDDFVASTEISDIVEDIQFAASGDALLLQFEEGDLVAMNWSELLSNDNQDSAVRENPLGINDCETLRCSTTSPSETFWVGHSTGVVSEHSLDLASGITAEKLRVFDSIALQTITAMDFHHAPDDNKSILISGSTDQTIAITRLDPKPSSTLVPLKSGPVRCVALSSDGRWYVAGADATVWVGSVDSPGEYQARLELGAVSAESLLIDEENDLLIVGCSDGSLATFQWTHARMRSLLRATKNKPEPHQETTPAPPSGDRYTLEFNLQVVRPMSKTG